MTRATRFAWSLAIATAVYLLFLFHIIPVPFISEEVTDQILPTIPWWVLVATGSSLLYQVGYGIYNFNDVPKAHDDLLRDIQTAKDYLREVGVTVD